MFSNGCGIIRYKRSIARLHTVSDGVGGVWVELGGVWVELGGVGWSDLYTLDIRKDKGQRNGRCLRT